MVLQCVWTITRATLSTAVVAVIAEVRIAKDEKALDEVYNQCLSMEMERKLSFEQRESRKQTAARAARYTRRFREPALYQQTDPMEPGSF